MLPWSSNNTGSWQAISSITNPLELSFSGGNTLTTETGQTAAQAADPAASHFAAGLSAAQSAARAAVLTAELKDEADLNVSELPSWIGANRARRESSSDENDPKKW